MRVFVYVVCAAAVLSLSLVAATYAAGAKDAGARKAKDEAIAQKTCPVMGNPINPKVFVDYKGRRIYFCCKMCVAKFKKDPEKYVKIVDEQLKQAKGDKKKGSTKGKTDGKTHATE